MDLVYTPYIDPNFESLIEKIHPPRVCIDNDSSPGCTLVKVDSANKHGILLEMVQVLTDLDLVISKSYISSDGGWLMDVFHVTDQFGCKLTDQSLMHYIQQALCASRSGGMKEAQTSLKGGWEMGPNHMTMHTALEMTCTDRPGLMSEISAVLADLGCHVHAAVAWTHKARVACIIHVEDELKGGPIKDPACQTHIEEQLENVVEAHQGQGERRSVRLTAPVPLGTHTERRLHQLMFADRDYERCTGCERGCGDGGGGSFGGEPAHQNKACLRIHVSIESCREKDYSVVHVRSRDRPKLLFDTVCALTDMQYVVFHAAVSSEGRVAVQEYYIRHMDGWTLDTASEKLRVTQCLIAAVERRVSHGLRLDISTPNRLGLLSNVTRVFRESGLSISRAEIGMGGKKAIGSFYVVDTSGHNVKPEMIELVRKEIGGTVLVVNESIGWLPQGHPSSSNKVAAASDDADAGSGAAGHEERPRFSLGSLLWSQLERLSINFGPIKS